MKQQEDQNPVKGVLKKEIWKAEQILETRTKHLQNQAITKYLTEGKNLPIVYLTWKDESFIQMHPKLPKR